MASLYKQSGSTNWYAKFFNEHGKRVAQTTGTPHKREAQKIAEDLESESRKRKAGNKLIPRALAVVVETAAREAADGTLTLARAELLIQRLHALANPAFVAVSLSDHLLSWVRAQAKHVGASTSGVYMDMHRHFTTALGTKISAAPAADLTAPQVEKALVELKKNLKGSTVNLSLGVFRRALHAAVVAGLAPVNVAVGIRPVSSADTVARAPFTAAEVAAMIAHKDTPPDWRVAILFGASTGLRLGDISSLTSDNIIDGRLVVSPQKTKRGGNGAAITIPLSAACLELVKGKKGPLMPTLHNRGASTLSYRFKLIMANCGAADKVTLPGGAVASRSFHSLRHSFTSWLANADVAADVRQKLTGHKSDGIHARYTHHDAALDRAIQALPNFFAKPVLD